MTKKTGRRVQQGHSYDYEGVKVIGMENSSRQVVKVCPVVENPPGVMTLGPTKHVHSGRLKALPMSYHGNQIP